MPPTIEAKLLLGWMPQSEALDFLLNKCVFDKPLDEAQAVEIWHSYKRRATELGARKCALPAGVALSKRERQAIAKFKASPPPMVDTILDIIKVNPIWFVIHQFFVVTERSEF